MPVTRRPLVVLLALLGACLGAAPDAPPRLRVLTYNIHHGEGADGKLDLPRIAGVIAGQKPDLVALQEVDVKTRRTSSVDQVAELAKLTRMHAAFGKAIAFQGGEYGNAVLSRFPIRAAQTHPLPAKAGSEKRCALAVVVRPWGDAGPDLTFASTHLDHLRGEGDRLAQAAEILRVLTGENDARAMVLAGDLNATPGSETLKRFTAKWKDAGAETGGPTIPSDEPNRRIDYVLLRPGAAWHVNETQVLAEPVASDHRPVLAVLEWRGDR
jgi:endonuclease/exonuclease/phosphatase family metal-dependent hydrolase